MNVIYPRDESLQSFLFRTLKNNGFYDYSSILVANKGWCNSPSIPIEAKRLITAAADNTHLMRLLESSVIAIEMEATFSNHQLELRLIESTFFSGLPDKIKREGNYVHFCPHCMEDQLVIYGFSYFKNSWLKNSYCSTHAVSLKTLRPGTVSQMVSMINKTLKCEFDDRNLIKKLPIKHQSKSIGDTSIKFLPCAKRQLIQWSLDKSKSYPEGFYDLADMGMLCAMGRKLLHSVRHRIALERNWEKHYQFLTEFYYDELMRFINAYMIFDFVEYNYLGFKSKASFALKHRNQKCAACFRVSYEDYIQCPNNQLIASQLNTPASFLSFCDKKYLQLESEVTRFQNQIGMKEGELNLKKDLADSRLYKRYGGKDNFNKHLREVQSNYQDKHFN